jgi:AraC-like DNA-binding protein
MTEATVAASFVRGLMEFAVSNGADPRELADRARIDPADLQDPDGRIPFGKYVALMRAAKELCNDPALALHFGETVDMSEMTIVGMTGNASGTMEDGIAQLNRFAPLVLDVNGGGDRYRLERIDGQLWMVDDRPNPNASPEITESAFARAVCGMRRRFGETEFVEELQFTHPEPAYREEYDRIFRVPVAFDCEKNAVRFSAQLWPAARAALLPRSVSEVLSAHAEALLEKLERSKTSRGRVESLLIPILHTGEASMDVVAGKLGLSRQTLFRRLKAEGVTFEKVLDELRHERALQYLNEKKLSVNETAYLVGFSDPAAFSRAFKRWTGSSPGTRRASRSGKDQSRPPE